MSQSAMNRDSQKNDVNEMMITNVDLNPIKTADSQRINSQAVETGSMGSMGSMGSITTIYHP